MNITEIGALGLHTGIRDSGIVAATEAMAAKLVLSSQEETAV
jgi:hypothetical protein